MTSLAPAAHQTAQQATAPRLAVLTQEGSRYGLKLLNALQWQGLAVEQVLLFTDLRRLRWRWLRGQARQIGWFGALAWLAWRPRSPFARQGNLWRGRPLERDYRRLVARVDRVPTPRSPASLQALAAGQPDLCLLAQSGILPARLLTVPRYGTLNVHTALLPDYRGLDPIPWALYERSFDRLGATLHLVDAGVDTGPILEQRPYRWRGDETLGRLLWRMNETSLDLLVEACRQDWPGYAARAVPQPGGRRYYLMRPWLLPRAQRNLALYLREGWEAGSR
jgi:hypothetical protein